MHMDFFHSITASIIRGDIYPVLDHLLAVSAKENSNRPHTGKWKQFVAWTLFLATHNMLWSVLRGTSLEEETNPTCNLVPLMHGCRTALLS